MKTKHALLSHRVFFIAQVIAMSSALALDPLPPVSNVEIALAPDAVNVGLTIHNAGNQNWVVQYSDNLSSWTDLETIKVHNGVFSRGYAIASLPAGRFYRAFYDSTKQTLTSTLATALILPVTPANYASPTLPQSFLVPPITNQDNMPANNITANAGSILGRALFYDKRLSANQTISCSSCHQREHGFSDPRKFSVGFQGGLTGRNSMGLQNARWYQRRRFFWDERSATLEDQVLQPIQNTVEMGMTLPDLVTRLAAEPYYQTLFTNAFGTSEVSADRIARALAQFVRSIISTQSKFDIGAATNFANFTAEENQGRFLFLGQGSNINCAACHGTDNFVPGGGNPNNNGLENPYIDKGIGEISGLAQDEGRFKVPSLRNIELTGPYMHDGRFDTLEQVVEFYNSQIVAHPNLSGPLRQGGGGPVQPRRMNFTAAQKAAMVAFLKTLTDTTIATDEKWSDPYNYGQ